jgi:hypothetical protein
VCVWGDDGCQAAGARKGPRPGVRRGRARIGQRGGQGPGQGRGAGSWVRASRAAHLQEPGEAVLVLWAVAAENPHGALRVKQRQQLLALGRPVRDATAGAGREVEREHDQAVEPLAGVVALPTAGRATSSGTAGTRQRPSCAG